MKNDWRKLLNQMVSVYDIRIRNSLGIIYICFHFQRGGHIYVHLSLITTIGNLSRLLLHPPYQLPATPASTNQVTQLSFRLSGHRSCTHYLSLVDIFKYFEVSIRRYFHLLSHMFPWRIFLALSLLGGFPYYCSTAYYSRYMKKCLFCQNFYEKRSRFLFRDFLIWSKTFQTFSCIYRP